MIDKTQLVLAQQFNSLQLINIRYPTEIGSISLPKTQYQPKH